MVEKVLELALKKTQAAEVHLCTTESRPVEFEHNQLKYVHTKSTRCLSLRVIRDGRLGFASTTDLSDPERLVSCALESARYGQEARFEFPASSPLPQVEVYDPAVADFPIERAIELGNDAIERVRGEFSDVQCSVDIGKIVASERLVNSAGLDLAERFTRFHSYLVAVRVRDGSILWVSDGESSRRVVADFERYTAKVIRDIRLAEREVEAPSGTFPVLFTARAVAMLVGFLEHAVNGKLVQKGASPLAGRLGEKVLGDQITIYDDPTLPLAEATSPYDGEGVATRRKAVFERGVLRTFLFDLQTAGLLGAEPTRNAARGFASPPVPGPTNFVVEAGERSEADLLASIEKGLVVDDVIGGGQSNVLAGEFSVNVGLGFLVEHGEIVGRVKDCMVAGNVFEAFSAVRGVGDRQEVHGPVIAPPICFEALHVAGS